MALCRIRLNYSSSLCKVKLTRLNVAIEGATERSPVVLLVHQVVARTKGHQVGIVGRRRDGDGACAAYVGVAQLVGEQLELIGRETVVVPQHMVVGGTTRALERK